MGKKNKKSKKKKPGRTGSGQGSKPVRGALAQGNEFLTFEITTEKMNYAPHSPRVEKLMLEGLEILERGAPVQAYEVFCQALALEPNAPDIQFNVLTTRVMSTGNMVAFRQGLDDLNACHPDYLFSAVQLAQFAIRDRDLDRAQKLLDPLFRRPRLHISEFRLLAAVQIDLCLALKQTAAAEQWLALLEQVAPDDPNLSRLRRRVRGWWAWLWSW